MPILPTAVPDRRTRTLPRTSWYRTALLSGSGGAGASSRVTVGPGNFVDAGGAGNRVTATALPPHVVVGAGNNVTVGAGNNVVV